VGVFKAILVQISNIPRYGIVWSGRKPNGLFL